jgi:hypothetical protein
MSAETFTITIHMVASLDGKVAKKDNSVDWFETTDHYENGIIGEDPEIFLKKRSCCYTRKRGLKKNLEM